MSIIRVQSSSKVLRKPGSRLSDGQRLGDRYSGKLERENSGVGTALSREGST